MSKMVLFKSKIFKNDDKVMDKEIFIKDDNSKVSASQRLNIGIWVLLMVFALLTINCALITAYLGQRPTGFVYKTPANQQESYNNRPYDYDDYYNDRVVTTTSPPSETYKIETNTIPPICWDYSGIWGGFIMMILTIGFVPNRRLHSISVCKSVCRVLALLTSCMVGGVAIAWSLYAGNKASSVFWDHQHDYDQRSVTEDHSQPMVVMVACAVGTATFATLYFGLLLFSSAFAAFYCACKMARPYFKSQKSCSDSGSTPRSESPEREQHGNKSNNMAAPVFFKVGRYWCTCNSDSQPSEIVAVEAGNNVEGKERTENHDLEAAKKEVEEKQSNK